MEASRVATQRTRRRFPKGLRAAPPADGALSWRALVAHVHVLDAHSVGRRGASPRGGRGRAVGGRAVQAPPAGHLHKQLDAHRRPRRRGRSAHPRATCCSRGGTQVRLALTLSLEWRARVADGATVPPACAAAVTAPPRPSPPAQQPRRRPSACGGHQQRAALDARAPRRRDHPAAVRAGQARPGQGQGKGKGKG